MTRPVDVANLVDAHHADGALTHVLYIDARDPANLKSKLIIHPKG